MNSGGGALCNPGPFLETARGLVNLILFFTGLLTIAFARQSFLHATLFAGLQIEGMPLHFLNDVLLLYFTFETAQRVFKRFALL